MIAGEGAAFAPGTIAAPPRLGFIGVGWIGRHRMNAVAASGTAQVVAVADSDVSVARAAAEDVGVSGATSSLDELLHHDLDGVVIATPSALHAEQATAVLEKGIPVFCQKPLARTAREARAVVDTAAQRDLLLGLDLSYRHVRGMQAIKMLVQEGALGSVHAIDVCFHNAYGPDKAWFKDPALSGGGCVIDLGTHLVDLALWLLDFPPVEEVTSRLFVGGRPLADPVQEVEDYGLAQLDLSSGAVVRVACSWYLPVGRDADIAVRVSGVRGGAALVNVGGSFYDFRAERYHGTRTEVLVEPPDEWGGRAIVEWAQRLRAGDGFDDEAQRYVDLADVIDRIYGRDG